MHGAFFLLRVYGLWMGTEMVVVTLIPDAFGLFAFVRCKEEELFLINTNHSRPFLNNVITCVFNWFYLAYENEVGFNFRNRLRKKLGAYHLISTKILPKKLYDAQNVPELSKFLKTSNKTQLVCGQLCVCKM